MEDCRSSPASQPLSMPRKTKKKGTVLDGFKKGEKKIVAEALIDDFISLARYPAESLSSERHPIQPLQNTLDGSNITLR